MMLGGAEIHENLMCITGENEYENVGMVSTFISFEVRYFLHFF